MNTNYNSRLYTFGCSFTKYCWPTWADILGQEYTQFENWGMAGGGNLFIFNSLIECITRNNITKDDTIIIMWTELVRNDVYSNSSWQGRGNIFYSENNNKFLLKSSDLELRGFAVRDFALIEAAKRILESIGCKFKFFSMVPFNRVKVYGDDLLEIPADVINTYKNSLSLIHPSVLEVEYNFNWFSTPVTVGYSYQNRWYYYRLLYDLENHYNSVAGADWPTWFEFTTKKISSFDKSIRKEFQHYGILEELDRIEAEKRRAEKELKAFCKFLKDSDPPDYHPLPLIHLNFIKKHFTISEQTETWITKIQEKILNHEYVQFDHHLPERL